MLANPKNPGFAEHRAVTDLRRRLSESLQFLAPLGLDGFRWIDGPVVQLLVDDSWKGDHIL
jgi:hypothetical protein